MKNLLIILVVLMGNALPNALQAQDRAPEDSILYLLKTLQGSLAKDSVAIKGINDLIIYNSMDLPALQHIQSECQRHQSVLGDDITYALRYSICLSLYFKGHVDQSIDELKLLIADLENPSGPYQEYILVQSIAMLRIPYRNSDRIYEGIEYYLRLASKYELMGDADPTCISYYSLRSLFQTIGLVDKAIYYQQKSIQFLDTDKIYNDQFLLMNGPLTLGVLGVINRKSVLGSIYNDNEEWEKGLPLLYEANALMEAYKDSIVIGDAPFVLLEILRAKIALKADDIGYSLTKVESVVQDVPIYLANFYLLKGTYLYEQQMTDSAVAYFGKCRQLRDDYGMGVQTFAGFLIPGYHLALIRFEQKRYNEALTLLLDEIKQLKAANLRTNVLAELALLAEVYKAVGDYKNATLALEDRNKIQAALLQDEAKNRSMTFEVEQSIVQKEKDMHRLEVENAFQRKSKYYVFGIAGLIALLAAGLFYGYRSKQKANKELSEKNTVISEEKERSETLLLNILPHEVAEELKQKGYADAQLMDEVTVLFTDFKGFTAMSEKLSPKELVKDIHECFSAFDLIIERHGIEKIKTIGDAYMAAGGLPTANTTHAADVVKAAMEIRDFIAEGKIRKIELGQPFFEIRIGIHTGPVVAGIVGVKKFAYDIWGDTVNTASRMESSGGVGEVNISQSTYAIVKEQFTCTHRGKVEAKGKGEIDMYYVTGESELLPL